MASVSGAAAVHVATTQANPGEPKPQDTEMKRLLEILKMRLMLITTQAATTRGQILVIKDALRRAEDRRRVSLVSREGQSAHLRALGASVPSATSAQLAPVLRRSKRAFAARSRTRRIIIAPKKKKEAVASPNSENWCSVCLEDVGDSEVTKTECRHTFHGQCIDRWVAEKFDNPTCPVCRAQLFVPV